MLINANCQTARTASHIIDSMDPAVDPCNDFYRFACGGWKESKYINDDQTGITEFGALRENLNRKMRGKLRRSLRHAIHMLMLFVSLPGSCHPLFSSATETALIEAEPKKDEPFYNDMMRLMYRQCMNQSKCFLFVLNETSISHMKQRTIERPSHVYYP
jgi:hypothetical protein